MCTVPLWVEPARVLKEGVLFVATVGLDELGLIEVEGGSTRRKPAELLGRIFDVANYLCLHGPVLKDGDTIGAPTSERILVRHADSVLNRPGPVIRVEFDGEGARRGPISRWFGR